MQVEELLNQQRVHTVRFGKQRVREREMGKAAAEGSLEVSPTWAVAVVCSIFVILSLALERALHYAGKWLKRHDQKSLYQALEKIKEELMLLGFLSLLLTVFQPVVAGICMPHSFVDHMLPCKLNKTEYFQSISEGVVSSPVESGHGRKLLTHSILYERQASLRRLLSSNGSNSKCSARGKVPYLSIEALHQLHIFIFVLAIVHVFYSFLTMVLSRIKIHTWHKWEKEAHIVHFDCVKAVMSIRPSFVAKHLNRPWSSSVLLSWMVSFLRQFGNSVNRTDYLTLRVGFINTHKTGSKFDFHNYVNRVMQDDFKRLVGISGYLWAFVVIFLLLNVQGWHTYFWIAFLPIIMIVIIGTKLQHIITTLAYGIADAQSCNGPDAVIQPRDELFWFHRPKLVLHLLHFTLFQNAFELAFFFWIWATFGFDSCFMDNRAFVVVRLVIGVVVQVVCSYSTLPLYALVTQMGTQYKAAIFQENITDALTGWHEKIKRKRKKKKLLAIHENGSSSPKNVVAVDKLQNNGPFEEKEPPYLSKEQGKSILEIESHDVNNEIEHSETSKSTQVISLSDEATAPHQRFKSQHLVQKVLSLQNKDATIQ